MWGCWRCDKGRWDRRRWDREGGIGGGGIGKVGKFQHGILCTWQLPWLAVEQCWLALAGPLLTLLEKIGAEINLLCWGTISGSVCRQFSGGVFVVRES